jgi:histone deacetylase complex subunit SAP18
MVFFIVFVCYVGATPENEIQIYTWMDASLKEITGLVKEVNPDARK